MLTIRFNNVWYFYKGIIPTHFGLTFITLRLDCFLQRLSGSNDFQLLLIANLINEDLLFLSVDVWSGKHGNGVSIEFQAEYKRLTNDAQGFTSAFGIMQGTSCQREVFMNFCQLNVNNARFNILAHNIRIGVFFFIFFNGF